MSQIELEANLPSYREINGVLGNNMSCEKIYAYAPLKLKKNCLRLCYHENQLLLLFPPDNCIELLSLEGQLIRTVTLQGVDRPRSMHPLNEKDFVLAARNGLFVVDLEGNVCKIREGGVRDVYVHNGTIAALIEGETDSVCLYESCPPHTQSTYFSIGHSDAKSILLAYNGIYVSFGFEWTCLTQYSMSGEVVRKCGTEGETCAGELAHPIVCAQDFQSGYVLVADCKNHRLQVLSQEGKWSVVEGMEEQYPQDVVIAEGHMYVLYAKKEHKYIQKYHIK